MAKIDNPWDYSPVISGDEWKTAITPDRPADTKIDMFRNKHTVELDALELKVKKTVSHKEPSPGNPIWLIGAIAGVIIFFGLEFGLEAARVPIVLSLVSSITVSGVIALLTITVLKNRHRSNAIVAIINPERDVFNSLKEAEGRINSVRETAVTISNFHVTNKIKGLCDRAEDVVNLVAAEPNTFFQARTALHQYLDSTVAIVAKLAAHVDDAKNNPETAVLWGKFDTLLETLQDGFDKQYDRILHNDLDGLDTEMQVLKRTIEMEGI
jgi:5-bromo-4-chloroindolyl phosphate hydrolysis protein